MSRRRASSSMQLTLENNNAEQKAAAEKNHTPDDEQPCHQGSLLHQMKSWRKNVSARFGNEVNRILLDDRVHESCNKILPSVVSFIFGLLLVKIYGDSFDSAITRCYVHAKNGFSASYGLLTTVGTKHIEAVAIFVVLALFWIGGLRILVNLTRKISKIP